MDGPAQASPGLSQWPIRVYAGEGAADGRQLGLSRPEDMASRKGPERSRPGPPRAESPQRRPAHQTQTTRLRVTRSATLEKVDSGKGP